MDVDASTPLLYVLRNDLNLNGPRFGCGLAQCGACIVLVNGLPVRSCVTPVSAVASAEVTTLEGLGERDDPHPVQKAFIAEQAAQCGYCSNGMIMAAASLLAHNPDPSDNEIRQALAGDVQRWHYDVWSPTHSTRSYYGGDTAGSLLAAGEIAQPLDEFPGRNIPQPAGSADRNAVALYAFKSQRIVEHYVT